MENVIKKILINDNGVKTPMNWSTFHSRFPDAMPHFEINVINGEHYKTAEVMTIPTTGCMYNVQEDMFYYIVFQSVIPHHHAAIIPSKEEAMEILKREAETHYGEVHLSYSKDGRMFKKLLYKE